MQSYIYIRTTASNTLELISSYVIEQQKFIFYFQKNKENKLYIVFIKNYFISLKTIVIYEF